VLIPWKSTAFPEQIHFFSIEILLRANKISSVSVDARFKLLKYILTCIYTAIKITQVINDNEFSDQLKLHKMITMEIGT